VGRRPGHAGGRHHGALTTQYLDEADELADAISILRDGRIVAEGTAAELERTVGQEVVEVRGLSGDVLHTEPTDGSPAALRRALDRIEAEGVVGQVTVRRPSLDDVFLTLTAAPAEAPGPHLPGRTIA